MPYFLYLGWGYKKPTFRMYQGYRNHHKEATSPKVGILPSQYPMLAKHRLIWGPHPNSLLQSADLIPQALQRGVPSSASLQSGVLWVLQEAQRRGPENAEAKGQESAQESRLRRTVWGEEILEDFCEGPTWLWASLKVLLDLRQRESQEGRQMAKLHRGGSWGWG